MDFIKFIYTLLSIMDLNVNKSSDFLELSMADGVIHYPLCLGFYSLCQSTLPNDLPNSKQSNTTASNENINSVFKSQSQKRIFDFFGQGGCGDKNITYRHGRSWQLN